MKKEAVVINSKDNVATVVDDFPVSTSIHYFMGQADQSVQLLQDIPLGHKVALREIKVGEDIVKYGESTADAETYLGQYRVIFLHQPCELSRYQPLLTNVRS